MRILGIAGVLALSLGWPGCATFHREPLVTPAAWINAFLLHPPQATEKGAIPEATTKVWPRFTVTPVAPGTQIVRVALPFPPGTMIEGDGIRIVRDPDASGGGEELKPGPDVRVLTLHPGTPRYLRRALVTFVYEFPDTTPTIFKAEGESLRFGRGVSLKEPVRWTGEYRGAIGETRLYATNDYVRISRRGELLCEATLAAPPRADASVPVVEVLEDGRSFLWLRLLEVDTQWPRIIEIRADRLGTVAIRAHVQRLMPEDGYAPELGWRITSPEACALISEDRSAAQATNLYNHDFASGAAARVAGQQSVFLFPDAHLLRKGALTIHSMAGGTETVYLRCRDGDQTPFQPTAWRSATFVLAKKNAAPWTPLLEAPGTVTVDSAVCDAVYGCGAETDLAAWPDLAALRTYHRDAIATANAPGDDFGNVMGMPQSGVFGMNRLNHCPAIFEEYYRNGDARLRASALLWCNNYHDLSIWWGKQPEGDFGGTRYNNAAAGSGAHKGDNAFMWRSNDAVHFCTKGMDTFFYAYEETGDPRMANALHWQVEYAKNKIHVDQGECRNIGDVLDFVRLYKFTGEQEYLDHALRLFRELRTKLSAGDLFSQGGQPIVPDLPFMDSDDIGYKHPFAKPYIIGYALSGLPLLADYAPDEPKLMDVVRAVAQFLAASQDPVGGWRYPHPHSSRVIIDQGIEHAAQLCRAANALDERGENIEPLLDAIERTLQARVNGFVRSGTFLSALGAWETATGAVPEGKTIQDLYKKPADRDPLRDYTEGAIGVGGACPEGVVYFSEVLAYYLQHRNAARLFEYTPELKVVLDRIATPAAAGEPEAAGEYPGFGIENGLPTFSEAQIARMRFPMAWDPAKGQPFDEWREDARAKLIDCLLTPPPAPVAFDPAIIAVEDRGTYEARKLVFSVSADCRVPAYLLVPKGQGPFPAVLALHDHGAHFSIGKEKVVRPFGVTREVLQDATQWVEECYGGRWIGDELAKRGYLVFAADALFWGERGRREGIKYEDQQLLAANLLQLGMTWSGVITWDDVRSAEFVASLSEVNPKRIGAIGLSMGSHRTWMLCAATDRIAAGAAICWMGTTPVLMAPGNNQTKGQSAFSMLVPNLRNFLDYPDVAAIACPKPMIFFNGAQDTLFPVRGVEAAYERIRRVYNSQAARDKLTMKIWPVPHIFNLEMQSEAFNWLDSQLK